MNSHDEPAAPTIEVDGTAARHQHLLIRSQPGLETIINAMPSIAIVLNHARQIIYANKAFLKVALDGAAEAARLTEYFSQDSDFLWDKLLGRQIGETLKCVRAVESQLPCGMAPGCRHCGIWQALAGSTPQDQAYPVICQLPREVTTNPHDQTLLFNVSVSPLEILHWDFQLLVLTDISSEAHYKLLEHVLFHDIHDIADGILSIAKALKEKTVTTPEELQLVYQLLASEAAQTSDELETHQTLIQAERGELKVRPVSLQSLDVLKTCITFFEGLQPGGGIRVILDPLAVDLPLKTDETLLDLIIDQMLYSAREISESDDTITAGCRREKTGVEFYVRNTSMLPEDKQSQLFTRSFTAKDTKLGMSTYTMKRIGEPYLDGAVSCAFSPEDGTVFSIHLPLEVS